jgi:hypothetical protein
MWQSWQRTFKVLRLVVRRIGVDLVHRKTAPARSAASAVGAPWFIEPPLRFRSCGRSAGVQPGQLSYLGCRIPGRDQLGASASCPCSSSYRSRRSTSHTSWGSAIAARAESSQRLRHGLSDLSLSETPLPKILNEWRANPMPYWFPCRSAGHPRLARLLAPIDLGLKPRRSVRTAPPLRIVDPPRPIVAAPRLVVAPPRPIVAPPRHLASLSRP